MKVLKVLGVVLLGLVIVLAIFFALVAANLDRAARFGVEQGGTYALGVPTTLEAADVGLMSGTFAMQGLTVANPEGFSTPHFLALGEGAVAVQYASLNAETIRLPEVILDSVDVHLDREDGRSNYETILDNLKRFESGDSTEPAPESDVAKQNIVVERLEIRNIVVHADVIGATPTPVVIDGIILTDVGSGGADAMQLADLFGVVTKAVLLGAVQTGAQLPGQLVQELQTNLAGLESLSDLGIGVAAQIGGVTQDLGGLAENISQGVFQSAEELSRTLGQGAQGVQDAAEEAGKAVEDAGRSLEDAARGIGNIFGGRKDEPEEEPGSGGGSGG